MNKERYNQIIDEAYENYSKEYEKDNSIRIHLPVKRVDNELIYKKPDKESFIGLCEHDKSFSERWGLKIEERELSLDERKQIFDDRGYVCDVWPFNGDWHGEYDGFRIPRRAISLTYNNETIEIR